MTTKRLNLYEKCDLENKEYTEDELLRNALDTYLRVKLAMKDMKGVNNWKGVLNELTRLSSNVDEQIAILNASSACGWHYVFPLKNNFKKSKSSSFEPTKTDYAKHNLEVDNDEQDKIEEKLREERLANGQQVRF